jgi:hypothetical protein
VDVAQAAGFDFIAAQLASVLGQLGMVGMEQRAIALRQRHRFTDMALWFEREQPWERQLNALINLQPAVNVEVVKESRLAWLLSWDEHLGVRELEPREQKRDAQGGWSRGRAVGLKRLAEEAAELDFLTAQDVQVAAAIGAYRYYSGTGTRYEFDLDKAVRRWPATRCCSGWTRPAPASNCCRANRSCWCAPAAARCDHPGAAAARAAGRGGGDEGDADPAAHRAHQGRAPPHRRHRRRGPGSAAGSGTARAAGDQRDLLDRHGAVGHRRQRRPTSNRWRPTTPAPAPAALPAGLRMQLLVRPLPDAGPYFRPATVPRA